MHSDIFWAVGLPTGPSALAVFRTKADAEQYLIWIRYNHSDRKIRHRAEVMAWSLRPDTFDFKRGAYSNEHGADLAP